MSDRRTDLPSDNLHSRGLLIAATGGVLFTLDVPLLRLAGADSWTMIFVRGLFLFTAIALWWYFAIKRKDPSQPFINGGTGLFVALTNTLANLMFIAAVEHTKAANLVFILALNPMFCAVMSWAFLGERVPWQTWLAMLLAVVGVGIIVQDGLVEGTWFGDLLAIGVALCTAAALTAIRKTGKNVVTSLATGSLVSALFASLFAAPLALTGESWMWLALNGLVVIPVASALTAIAPRYLPAAEAAMFFLLEAVLVPIWVWLIFKELPSQNAMIGGFIVIATLLGHSLWRLSMSSAGPRPMRRRGPVGQAAE